ncbi:prepilin peptidase [Streptomyces sp. NPDC093586]|uniref:prepilin peptidase n=1 Tax=Streptomyces sp. NPDC093586 TaxID=3366042 RepID=UPI0037F8C5FD
MLSVDVVDVLVLLVAVLWGAVTGALLPRAAYRFSAPSGEAWHDACPAAHPLRGWLGPARCARCASPAEPREPGAAAARPRAVPGGPRAVADGSDAVADGRPAPASYGPGAAVPAVVTALVCAALAAATGTRPELAVWLLLAPAGVLLAVVDLRVRRLPDPLTLPLAGTALALLGVTALLPEHAGEWSTALLGALALGAGYFALFLVNPAGMAFGDVKLALGAGAVLGWYGWPTLMLGTFAGFLLGAVYGGALVVAGRAGRRTAIAFGPFLLAGAFLGVLAGAYAA